MDKALIKTDNKNQGLKPYEDSQKQTYLANLETKVPTVDRLELIKGIFFMRRIEDSGHKHLEKDVLKLRVISLERHLSNKGVVPEDYALVYEIACQIHASNGAKGPFGIDEILMGADALLAKKATTKIHVAEERVQRRNCEKCKGTTLKYVEGKLQYQEISGKKIVMRCECYEN